MPKNAYTTHFKADSVNFDESHPDLGYTKSAEDLGINRGALKTWVRQDRIKRGIQTNQSTGTAKTSEDGLNAEHSWLKHRLRIRRCENGKRRWNPRTSSSLEERDFLRKATKYFVAETNW